MAVDYFSLLTKAVSGKDAVARDQIYKDAYGLITKSHLTREAAASHAAALQDAVRRIEDNIAAETHEGNAAEINEVLSTGRNWKALRHLRLCALAVIALSALVYGYVATSGPGIVAASVKMSSPKAQRGREDVVMADLKPGVDGGSSGEVLPFALQRQVVFYRTTVVPGSIVSRPGKPLSLSDRRQQFRAPLRDRDCKECLKGGSFSRVITSLNGLTGGLRAPIPKTLKRCGRRPAVPAVRSVRGRSCWTSPG